MTCAMGGAGARAWDCAQALLGAPFRLQGRSAATGLDCVGLVIAAYAGAGLRLGAIDDYALRGYPPDAAVAALDASGLGRAAGAVRRGDVALYRLPARQLHLALVAPGRLIHADAALRRVVAAPASRLPEPCGRWRPIEDD